MDFKTVRDIVVRATYRGLLRRDPEPVVNDLLGPDPFSAAENNELADLVRDAAASPEFRLSANLASSATFPPRTWACVELADGLKLWVDLGDIGVSRNCILNEYEPMETAFLKSVIQPGMTFVDIGANIGWFTVLAADRVGPTGRIIAFEPRLETYHYMRRTLDDNGFGDRLQTYQAAVGAENGRSMIGWAKNTSNPGGTWSLPDDDLQTAFKNDGGVIQEVEVVSLDRVLDGKPVHIIKIDIEGAEPIALRGATEVLSRHKPLILSEINPAALVSISKTTAAEYVSHVCGFGYHCEILTPAGIGDAYHGGPLSGPDNMINVVFTPVEK